MKKVLLFAAAALALSACEDLDDYGQGPPGYFGAPYAGYPHDGDYRRDYRDRYYGGAYGPDGGYYAPYYGR